MPKRKKTTCKRRCSAKSMNALRQIQAYAHQIRKQHPNYSWKKCISLGGKRYRGCN